MSENDNSQIDIQLRVSLNDSSENEGVSIFEMETQKYEEGRKTVASSSIHDMETQNIPTDVSKDLEANATVKKQLSTINLRNKMTGSSATNIHDIETQDNIDGNEEQPVTKNKIDMLNATAKKCMKNIQDLETQYYPVDSTKNIRDTTAKKSVMNIYDIETQNYIVDNAKNNTGIRELGNDKNKVRVDQVKHDIHDLETQNLDNERTVEDICDMETQLALDRSESSNSRADKNNEDKNKDMPDVAKSGTSRENYTKLPSSRSSSPGLLNLSSPEIDENCPSSPLNESAHLLESSDLLEYFADGIDKLKECNASTPKPRLKTSSQKDNAGNTASASDNENDDQEDNIHDLPTQCISSKSRVSPSNDSKSDEKKAAVKRMSPKKTCRKPRPTQIDDDSETDAEEYLEELARKQGKSLEAPSKSRDTNVGNSNDPETSGDSDDMFDMLTQQSKDHSAKNTSSSSINQQPKTNQTYAVVDDMQLALTQKMDYAKKDKRDDRSGVSSADINDTMPTQPLLPRKVPPKTAINSKNSSLKNNQNNVDDIAPTQVMHANVNVSESDNCHTSPKVDSENIDYETAPTQVIGEVVEGENSTRTSDRTKSSKVDLNDTLERNLNEMFDDVNSESVHEHALMSTQCLEDILQASQCDNEIFPKSTVETVKASTDDALRAKSGKKSDRLSRNAMDSEVNKNNANETDSQKSDIYFATITTRRKRNVIKDTQDIIDFTEAMTSSRQAPNIPQKSKGETKNNNLTTKSNKRSKRIAKSKSKTDATTDDLIDDIASKTTSSENNEKIVQKTKSVKQKNGSATKTKQQILQENSCGGEVDHAEGNYENNRLDTCAPCPSKNGQDAQKLSTLCQSDDDILTRLPAVRISGTLSNPPSPSASSTSTVHSARSKPDDARSKTKGKPSKNKPLRTRNIKNSDRTDNKSPLPSHDIYSSSVALETMRLDTVSKLANDSDSDSATSYRRFKQMADRMLSKERDDSKEQSKGNNAVQKSSKSTSNKKKNARSSPSVSKDPKQGSDLEESKNPVRTNLRATRSSNKQDNMTKEACTKDAIGKSTKPERKSAAVNRKRGLNTEENTEQTDSKKYKMDEVIGKTAKIVSKETREISNTKTENVDTAKSSVTRGRRKVTDSQAATRIENTSKNKQIQAKERQTLASQVVEKTLKIILDPIIDEESREVEMIMRNVPSNTRDENSSVREGNNVRTFQRGSSSRSTRSSKRANTNVTTDSSSIENSTSSETSDLESVQSGSIAPTRNKRGRFVKKSVPPPQETRVPEKEVFKIPTRINRYSAIYTDNSATENSMSDDSRSSIQSDGSLNIRLSRSKTAGTKSTWKIEMNESSSKKRMVANTSISSEINTSVDSTLRVSTPTRARRSTSSMSISSPSIGRHRILFTGITEDTYDNVIKTLGGTRVETPKLCTVLVTDKVRRTYKFLCALAKGIPIVSINWLSDSESAAQFLDWEGYILKDRVAEAKFGFRLRKSLDKAKEKGLLVGYTIVLTPNIEQPPTKELKDMITSCGGKALLSPPTTWPEKAVIISRAEDLPNAKKYLAKAPKTVTVHTTEFILISILRQEVNFDKHRLI
ncbi:mediator of DNA damage checkpoint protein 1-like [Odontomachus brunneus]|uniref:mediator of DNA damage checkpoint protein 1-like n=1 Tax=Odontomachus brunneus TaxID=486640 RepID=UPI0013F29E0A|nr:mediator of DNA damage checkpoint protein 1-like [Odontomachus brunneus]